MFLDPPAAEVFTMSQKPNKENRGHKIVYEELTNLSD